MVSFSVSFALGIWYLQQQATLPPLPVIWPLVLLPLFFPVTQQTRLRLLQHGLLLVCAMLLGFYYATWIAQSRLTDRLPDEWQGRDISLTGVIAEMPRAHERGLRFVFDVGSVDTPDAHVPRRILLSTYDTKRHPRLELHAGERWYFTVRLKQPHTTLNPYGSDFEAWALERNIRATGYVYNKVPPTRLAEAVHSPAYLIERLRESIREDFQTSLSDSPYRGILTALAIGDQASISQGEWRLFTRTGVNHLMSISGLHITMLASLFFALTYHLWRRSTRLTLSIPARKAAAVVGLLVALIYSLISGFEIPAQRTFYMLSAFAGMLFWSRNIAPSQMLAAALIVVLLMDPWAVMAPGFWLSFGAVALIFYVTANRLARPHWLREYGRVQWAMTIGLIPPLLAMFQQLSLVSPLANAIAIPLVSLVVVPLTLLGTLPLFDWALHLAHFALSIGMAFLQWLDQLPLVIWAQHAPPSWTIGVGVLGALWILAPRGFPLRVFGVILLLPMLMFKPEPPPAGSARVWIFDVGQGLAVAVQTQQHALLFDTGPDYTGEADSGNRILVPALRGMGISRLDRMILSHGDLDHIGGTASVVQAVPTAEVLTSMALEDARLSPLPSVHNCHEGMSWNWDGVQFDILHPGQSLTGKQHDNDLSCVLRITIVDQHILLTGDIEQEAETRLLQHQRDKLPADLLVAPHHGSKSSSGVAFVRAVNPRHVVFTAGYRNRFHHPHPEVVQRYAELGATLWQSDRDGALLVELDAHDMRIEAYRQNHRRYWMKTLAKVTQ